MGLAGPVSADLLRRAAAHIRSTATLAARELDGDPWDTTDPGEADDLENHVALWSPDVAGDVADLLDDFAAVAELDGYPAEPESPALRLARRILGEDAARRILGEDA